MYPASGILRGKGCNAIVESESSIIVRHQALGRFVSVSLIGGLKFERYQTGVVYFRQWSQRGNLISKLEVLTFSFY